MATLWRGRPRWDTPLLFVVGFLVVFVMGGITGVMVASAPFDFQVHDSFFVVAHFHYVLLGGVMFPIFAGLHHWLPKFVGRRPSETLGRLAFWMILVGFNIAFFPQHIVGLLGMPRRVYTYHSGLGWDAYNLLSTAGAFLLAAGVLVFTANLVATWRRGLRAGDDPWGADTLEWSTPSPPPPYNFRSIPLVGSRAPLWEEGEHGIDPEATAIIGRLSEPTGMRREQVRTSMLDARPEAVFTVPGPSYWPLVTAVALTVLLVGILVEAVAVFAAGVAGAVVGLIGWLYPSSPHAPDEDASSTEAVFPGATDRGRRQMWHGTLFGLGSLGTTLGSVLYAYFYLSVTVDEWPPPGTAMPSVLLPTVMTAALVVSGVPLWPALAARLPPDRAPAQLRLAASLLPTLAVAAGLVAILDDSGVAIDANAYGGIFVTVHAFYLCLLAAALLISVVVQHRLWKGRYDDQARTAVQVVALWWWFLIGAWVIVWAVLYLTPQLR